jgi:hypothetical protein
MIDGSHLHQAVVPSAAVLDSATCPSRGIQELRQGALMQQHLAGSAGTTR